MPTQTDADRRRSAFPAFPTTSAPRHRFSRQTGMSGQPFFFSGERLIITSFHEERPASASGLGP